MVAEVGMKYRGVICLYCQRPIPLSARVASVDAKLRKGETTSLADEVGPRAFSMRCRSCHREGLYYATQFIECEGTPPTREFSSKSGPERFRLSNLTARAANG
jgi:hypothetical protein